MAEGTSNNSLPKPSQHKPTEQEDEAMGTGEGKAEMSQEDRVKRQKLKFEQNMQRMSQKVTTPVFANLDTLVKVFSGFETAFKSCASEDKAKTDDDSNNVGSLSEKMGPVMSALATTFIDNLPAMKNVVDSMGDADTSDEEEMDESDEDESFAENMMSTSMLDIRDIITMNRMPFLKVNFGPLTERLAQSAGEFVLSSMKKEGDVKGEVNSDTRKRNSTQTPNSWQCEMPTEEKLSENCQDQAQVLARKEGKCARTGRAGVDSQSSQGHSNADQIQEERPGSSSALDDARTPQAHNGAIPKTSKFGTRSQTPEMNDQAEEQERKDKERIDKAINKIKQKFPQAMEGLPKVLAEMMSSFGEDSQGFDTFKDKITQVAENAGLKVKEDDQSCDSESEEEEQEGSMSNELSGVEVVNEMESDLHDRFILCQKNPGHKNFIPVEEFNKDHLPEAYRDDDTLRYISTVGDLTVRISTGYISKNRPDKYLASEMRGKFRTLRGTGWVLYAQCPCDQCKLDGQDEILFNSQSCPCEDCKTSSEKRTVALIGIVTAGHVVYGNDEARQTKCDLFFDRDTRSSQGSDRMRTLQASSVSGNHCMLRQIATKFDYCVLHCFTHDLELCHQVKKMVELRETLYQRVMDKYRKVGDKDRLALIISHPHGSSKHISIGKWTNKKDNAYGNTQYAYDTPTCSGSSGGPVILLDVESVGQHLPAHSGESRKPGINTSGSYLDPSKMFQSMSTSLQKIITEKISKKPSKEPEDIPLD